MKTKKLIYNIGINDYEGSTRIKGKSVKSYKVWTMMLKRCYDDKCRKKYPTYIGCTVSDEWHNFKAFNQWYNKNYPKELEKQLNIKFELDKDLLKGESKIYSPDTCIFLPKKINSFMTNNKNTNKSGYVGVSFHKRTNKWQSRIRDFDTNKQIYLGCFADIEQASKAYTKAREIETDKAKRYLIELGYSEDIVSKIY